MKQYKIQNRSLKNSQTCVPVPLNFFLDFQTFYKCCRRWRFASFRLTHFKNLPICDLRTLNKLLAHLCSLDYKNIFFGALEFMAYVYMITRPGYQLTKQECNIYIKPGGCGVRKCKIPLKIFFCCILKQYMPIPHVTIRRIANTTCTAIKTTCRRLEQSNRYSTCSRHEIQQIRYIADFFCNSYDMWQIPHVPISAVLMC